MKNCMYNFNFKHTISSKTKHNIEIAVIFSSFYSKNEKKKIKWANAKRSDWQNGSFVAVTRYNNELLLAVYL